MNTKEYDKVAYKKYKAYCLLEWEELVKKGCDVECRIPTFEEFMKRIKEDSEFAKVWGYWNFL